MPLLLPVTYVMLDFFVELDAESSNVCPELPVSLFCSVTSSGDVGWEVLHEGLKKGASRLWDETRFSLADLRRVCGR